MHGCSIPCVSPPCVVSSLFLSMSSVGTMSRSSTCYSYYCASQGVSAAVKYQGLLLLLWCTLIPKGNRIRGKENPSSPGREEESCPAPSCSHRLCCCGEWGSHADDRSSGSSKGIFHLADPAADTHLRGEITKRNSSRAADGNAIVTDTVQPLT